MRDRSSTTTEGRSSHLGAACTLERLARASTGAVVAVLFAVCPGVAGATDFYVDPQSGSTAGDGSAQKPWKTLREVIASGRVESQIWASLPYAPGAKLVVRNAGAPVKAGDTIWLRSGYHGAVDITGYYNASPITIAAEAGQTPKLSRVLVRASKNWTLKGLSVSPSFAPKYDPKTMITISSDKYSGPVSQITVEDCTLFSVADTSKWTKADWNNLAANGIQSGGSKITLRNNQLRNVNFGLSVSSGSSLVAGNLVDAFAGDGMRGLGDNTVFEYNTVKNCYDVNANHDDGFQSWSVGSDGKVGTGQVVGIVLRGNTIIDYEDPNQPFRGTLQGIGAFDGMFVDWVVENNVIITDHWHGITLLGAKNALIVNNTVLDPNQTKPGPPWIRIANHKNGTASTGIVRNNLATAFNDEGAGVIEDHNQKITDSSALFVNAAGYDLHLLPTAAAIDVGSTDLAPALDHDRIPRPQGAGIDLGAYEWNDGSAVPVDGGGSGSAAGGSSGSGASATSGAAAGDDSGCGCRTAPAGTGLAGWLLAAVLGLAGLTRRRRCSR